MTQSWRSQFQFGQSLTPVVKRLLIVLVAIWVVTSLLLKLFKLEAAAVALDHLALTPSRVVHGEVWQLLSYAWLHEYGGLSHMLFNGMALFFFGPELERRWGGRSFLKFYLLTAFFAGVFSVLVGLAWPRLDVPIIGASGAIFGLLAAWSMLMPNREILLFFALPLKIKYLVWLSIGIDLLLFIANGTTDVAFQTHIGGALTGWFLITGNWKPRVVGPKLSRLLGRKPKRSSFRVVDGGRRKPDRDLLH